MALREHNTESTGRFLHIQRGAICLKTDKPTEGYEEISGEVDGKPFTTYVRKFAAVDGYITKIVWDVREHAGTTYRGLKVTIKDKGENYVLDLPFGKRQYDYFTKIAENIDYAQPVEFIAWQDRQDDRVTAFACKQNGNFVQWKYTKDDMGECPPAVQAKVTGKWSFDAQREWLLDRILTIVVPHVDEVAKFTEPQAEYEDETANASNPSQKPATTQANASVSHTGMPDERPFVATEPPDDIEDVIAAF